MSSKVFFLVMLLLYHKVGEKAGQKEKYSQFLIETESTLHKLTIGLVTQRVKTG